MKSNFSKRLLTSMLSLSVMTAVAASATLPAFADAGEAPPEITEEEYVFPDPDSFSYDDVEVNFAKALQYSLYFYDANKCGPGITGGNLEWRGDCHTEDATIPLKPYGEDFKGTNLSEEFIDEYSWLLDPDGDGKIDCSGGMHDAGDHVKFCLPGSYAASTLGWGYYEFRDAYAETGNQEHVEDILHWFNDFYMKSTYLDKDGKVVAYCYQVGEGNIDHNYWNAPELQNESLLDFARPAYFATVETPASDMCAGTAASLAINYLNFKDTEPEYAEESLQKAIALYDFAVETHSEEEGMKVTSLGYDGGFYTSSYDYDELAWAAVWLYECTGEWDYIDDIIHVDETISGDMGAHPYTGYLKRIIADTGNCWQNIWVHCWDTVWGGVFAKLAPITNISRDWYIFRWNLEYWSGMTEQAAAEAVAHAEANNITMATNVPAVTAHKNFGLDDQVWNTTITAEEIADLPTEDGAFLAKTPAGFSMLNEYGSARYDTAAQLCACVYAKETGDTTFVDWAQGQMEYIMGKNPMNRPYIVGYSETAASHPHHRAAHGSKTLNMDEPADQTHVLWGALVGGPDSDDWHRDITKDYIYNEVAVDYNAAFVGACAGLYSYCGTEDMKSEENFPPSEESMKGEINEFYVEACIRQENTARSQVEVTIYNDTSLPPRYEDDMKIRYFFDISEMVAAGQTVDDISLDICYDAEKSNTNGESFAVLSEPLPWDEENNIYYVEVSWQDCMFYGSRVFHWALIGDMDANYETNWDHTNDYSRQGLLIDEITSTELICMYVDGELVWGIEPPGGAASEPIKTLYGDVNVDGMVNVADIVLLARYISQDDSVSVDTAGIANADCAYDSSIDADDAGALQMYLAGMAVTLGPQ
ncbi:MAG: glycoside hydrolase family 9 protein [Ruminococcus sp.]|nr:glycoside hydrolase family 9 protein [Ruminococcus sp.]